MDVDADHAVARHLGQGVDGGLIAATRAGGADLEDVVLPGRMRRPPLLLADDEAAVWLSLRLVLATICELGGARFMRTRLLLRNQGWK